MSEELVLKWGTLKGWTFKTDASLAALKRYFDAGSVSMSAMAQHDNPEQQAAILEMIDVVDGDIINDWTGKTMTKDQAKAYITEYRR